ncbi:MAG: ArnT family glycosyltransferase [Candidatus Polarisedimenticolia bacterium]
MKRRRTLWMVCAIMAVALSARLAHLAAIQGHPFYDLAESWTDSDMHQFLVWARHLAAGDWLDRETFRPWFDYQVPIAPPEVWRAWFGPHVYHQPPLYPYLMAVVLAATGSVDAFRVGQLALGAVNCGLIALLAARVWSTRAGWIAGLAAAVYAPFILYDGELLRGTVVMTTQLLTLLALVRWHDRRTSAAAILPGAALGLAWLADPAVLLFAPLAALWMLAVSCRAAGRWRPTATGLMPVACLAAGFLAAIVPLATRNAAVGAPPLSSTTRGPIAFVMGNAPDARPAGAYVPPSAGPILRASQYGMAATMRETLRLYQGNWGALAGKQWEKLVSLWSAYEVPDNPSFYYAARISSIVRYALRFLPVAALGLVGLALSIPRVRAGDPLALLVPFYMLATLAIFLMAHVTSRYRQPLAMSLIVMGAGAAAWAWESKGVRGAAALAAAGVLMLVLPTAPPEGYGYQRPAEYVMVARTFQERGAAGLAIEEMSAAVAAARREEPYRPFVPTLLFELGGLQAGAGRLDQAAQSFREVLAADPGFTEARDALREVEQKKTPALQATPGPGK